MSDSSAQTTPLQAVMELWQARVNRALDKWLPAKTTQPAELHKAMRSSVLTGGKRIRPVLTYATGEALCVDLHLLDNPASAVELIHAYSLIHDDLPAMDDDDLRRGQPTCHKIYGEAVAILAGDALQPLAFQILAKMKDVLPDRAVIELIELLAQASGSRGMAGGQAIDLDAVGKTLSLPELENMHIHKTGALIRASVKMGALCLPNIEADTLAALDHYGKFVGLAFQVQDDILDVEGDTEVMGKTQGSDMALNKPTYPAVLGLQGAKDLASELHEQAIAQLDRLGKSSHHLIDLSAYIIGRVS